jgi:hypothetical protein
MKPMPMGSAAACVYGNPEWEVRAGQYKYNDIEYNDIEYNDIEVTVARLHGMLDAPLVNRRQHRKPAQKASTEGTSRDGR